MVGWLKLNGRRGHRWEARLVFAHCEDDIVCHENQMTTSTSSQTKRNYTFTMFWHFQKITLMYISAAIAALILLFSRKIEFLVLTDNVSTLIRLISYLCGQALTSNPGKHICIGIRQITQNPALEHSHSHYPVWRLDKDAFFFLSYLLLLFSKILSCTSSTDDYPLIIWGLAV